MIKKSSKLLMHNELSCLDYSISISPDTSQKVSLGRKSFQIDEEILIEKHKRTKMIITITVKIIEPLSKASPKKYLRNVEM